MWKKSKKIFLFLGICGIIFMSRIIGRFGEKNECRFYLLCMRIDRLRLNNYRNYEKLDIKLGNGLNIFIGNNAQGKSNVLESIFVLALTKSYMNIKDQNLIRDNSDFTKVKGDFFIFDKRSSLEIVLSHDLKKLKINNKEIKKFSDYISRIKVLIFSPFNINFIKESPNVRRKLINMEMSQFSNSYVKLLQNYNAILRTRNQALKTLDFNKMATKLYFETLNEKFCSLAVAVIKERYKFIYLIEKFLADIYSEIVSSYGLEFRYLSCIDYCDDSELMLSNFSKKLAGLLEREKLYGMTLIGPHRDDFNFYLNGKELSIYGSQGQLRAAMLALKLAEVLVFKERDGDYPILLLDDVFSELDIDKRNKLVKYILEDVQTIITTTDIEMIDENLVNKSKIFIVDDGKIVEDRKKECKDE